MMATLTSLASKKSRKKTKGNNVSLNEKGIIGANNKNKSNKGKQKKKKTNVKLANIF